MQEGDLVHMKTGRYLYFLHLCLLIISSKFCGSAFTFFLCFLVGFLINDGRVETVAKIMDSSHQSFCCSVIGWYPSFSIKPPDGHVVISAPLSMDDKAIEVYARTNLSWIKKQIEKFQQQPRSAKRQYVSGETMYIWGKQYYLSFVPDAQKNSFEIQGDKVILSMREYSTVKQRENYVREQYRSLLKVEIERLLPKWEQITELHCESWQTKYMVTRWGTCNTEKKKLWFNLQLAQKPIECLEYVILHELIHLRERTHN